MRLRLATASIDSSWPISRRKPGASNLLAGQGPTKAAIGAHMHGLGVMWLKVSAEGGQIPPHSTASPGLRWRATDA